jgi:hypothetical protein
MKLGQFLKGMRSIDPDELKDILNSFGNSSADGKIECEFYLIRCDKDKVRIDDFIEFLHRYIVKYALSYADTHHGAKKLSKQQIEEFYIKNMASMVSKAHSLYIKSQEYTGEPGELLLFIILESRGIIQLLNKMGLKTNPEMAYHGVDALHIGVQNGKDIIIYYGHSKMCKELSDALSEAVSEIDDFSKNIEKEKHEFNLISSHIDTQKFGEHSEEIKRLLSPYTRHKENFGRAHAVFLGYEWDILGKTTPPQTCTLEEYFVSKYNEIRDENNTIITKKISGLSNASKHAFLVCSLPFPNLEELRLKWRKKIGALKE